MQAYDTEFGGLEFGNGEEFAGFRGGPAQGSFDEDVFAGFEGGHDGWVV